MQRVLILLCLVLSVNSFALVRLGLQGGISSSNVSAEPAATTNSRSGLALGAALELGLGTDLNLQIEGLYLAKGYVVPAGVLPETTVKTDYFEVPILLKYTIDLLLLKPYLMFGPYFGFKSKAVASNAVGDTDLTTIKSTDFGLSFGGGLELALTPMTGFFATVRYDLGLTNITDTAGNSAKTKALLIVGGLLFGI